MKDELKVFEYEGKSITFNLGNGDVMVNATEMAKSFGKNVKDWTRLRSTNDYINALKSAKGQISLLDVIKGGNNPGTWMHEDVAIEFARWLSPMFAIWCNDRIKELMKTGTASIHSLPRTFAEALRLAADLETQRELERSQKEIAQAKLIEQRPDVKFANAVKNSNSDCLIGELAKLMCQNGVEIGQRRLFQWMRDNGYLMKIGRQKNQPTQRAVSAGLIRLVKKRIFLPGGKEEIVTTPFVTGEGQVYFINKFLKEGAE